MFEQDPDIVNLIRDELAVNRTMICFLENRESKWAREVSQRAKALATRVGAKGPTW